MICRMGNRFQFYLELIADSRIREIQHFLQANIKRNKLKCLALQSAFISLFNFKPTDFLAETTIQRAEFIGRIIAPSVRQTSLQGKRLMLIMAGNYPISL